MKPKLLYEQLLNVIENSDIKVRKDILKSGGGYCIINNNKVIVLNKVLPPESHCKILAKCINDLQIVSSDFFIPPGVREYLEDEFSLLEDEKEVSFEVKND